MSDVPPQYHELWEVIRAGAMADIPIMNLWHGFFIHTFATYNERVQALQELAESNVGFVEDLRMAALNAAAAAENAESEANSVSGGELTDPTMAPGSRDELASTGGNSVASTPSVWPQREGTVQLVLRDAYSGDYVPMIVDADSTWCNFLGTLAPARMGDDMVCIYDSMSAPLPYRVLSDDEELVDQIAAFGTKVIVSVPWLPGHVRRRVFEHAQTGRVEPVADVDEDSDLTMMFEAAWQYTLSTQSRPVQIQLFCASTQKTHILDSHTDSSMNVVRPRILNALHPALRDLSILVIGRGFTGPLLAKTGPLRSILGGSNVLSVTAKYALCGGGKRKNDSSDAESASAAAQPFDPFTESSVRIEEVGDEACDSLAPATSSRGDEMTEWIRQDRLAYAARLAAFAKEHNMEHLPEDEIREAMADADQQGFYDALCGIHSTAYPAAQAIENDSSSEAIDIPTTC
jgi:hypothetical protein